MQSVVLDASENKSKGAIKVYLCQYLMLQYVVFHLRV